MRTSTERILTTHVGSLPRPQAVVDMLFAEDRGAAYDATMQNAVNEIIAKQQRLVGVIKPSRTT